MAFEAPLALSLLAAVPLIVVLYTRRWRHILRMREQIAAPQRAGNPSTRLQFTVMLLLLVAGSTSVIIAAAGPRITRERPEEIYRKVDVVFLLDASLSMRARDVAPSRLHRATEEIETFLRHNGDRIGRVGLVSFSGSSIILSYLTSDRSNILFFLEHLREETQPALGTDIGAAVNSGLSVLEKEKALDATLQAKGLIFVLVSDGEDHGETVREAVTRAARAGVRIYATGIGTEMGDYIPIGQTEGRTVFLVDEQGKQVIATFDEGTLQWVAEASGGRYFRSRSGEDLQWTLGVILQSERVVVDVRTSLQEVPLHPWFLAFGLGALAVRMGYRR